jgi:hypothetical protein
MVSSNQAIDQLTEVPVELFDQFRIAGKEARNRGQHHLVKGLLRNSHVSLKSTPGRKSLRLPKLPWHHDSDLNARSIGEKQMQVQVDRTRNRTRVASDASCNIKARSRLASASGCWRDFPRFGCLASSGQNCKSTRLNVSAVVGAAFRAIRHKRVFSDPSRSRR